MTAVCFGSAAVNNEMRRAIHMATKTRRTLAAFVATLAFTALAAASASAALPEFTGSYPNAITFSSSGAVTMEGETSPRLTCEGAIGRGTITGAKTLTATLTFKHCTDAVHEPCTSAKAEFEEVQTEALKSSLAYISKSKKEVGIVLNQHETGEPTFATFSCREGNHEPIQVTVRDAVVAHITALNTKTKTYTVNLKASGGQQSPGYYENEAGKKVETFLEAKWTLPFLQTSLNSLGTMSTTLETEIRA
jgi:hypothetical protein